MKRTILGTLICCLPMQALGHARLLPMGPIPPRSNNAGIKTGPCGGLARSASPTVLQRGSSLVVRWEETINHPGRYEFYFSPAGETNWTLLKTVIDTQDTTNDLPHQYETSLTLPDIECTDCTIQMIQVMTENPANPSLYFSCADVRLTSLNGSTPPPPTPPSDPVKADQTCH